MGIGLMIGFIIPPEIQEIYRSANLVNWLDVFNSEIFSEQTSDISLTVEQAKEIEAGLPFSKTLGKFDEIQLEIKRIQDIWSEGYNYRTKEIEEIESLIEGLAELNNFINNYWNYFTSDEKIRLVTQANLLKWYLHSMTRLTFRKCLKIVFSKKFFKLVRLYYKYRKNIWENPQSHVFIQLKNFNQTLTELILSLAKEDFEKAQKSISLEEYQALVKDYSSLEETAYLLSSPVNAERLLRSLAQAKAGKGVRRELIE